MAPIPESIMENPTRISPASFFFSFFTKNSQITPTAARTGAKAEGLHIRIQKLLPSRPQRLKIQAVTVVPTLAPIIIPAACVSFMIPELTNPTTITVVAADDCSSPATPAPKSAALTELDAGFSSRRSSRPPDTFSILLPMSWMPYRKNASPPIRLNIPKISIYSSLCYSRVFSCFSIHYYRKSL